MTAFLLTCLGIIAAAGLAVFWIKRDERAARRAVMMYQCNLAWSEVWKPHVGFGYTPPWKQPLHLREQAAREYHENCRKVYEEALARSRR